MKTPEPGADHPCAKCVHPEPVCLGVAGRPGAQWRWREVDLEVQTTKTLIEPRLELPGLPGRVLELNGNKFLSTSSTTIIGKDLLESSTTILLYAERELHNHPSPASA